MTDATPTSVPDADVDADADAAGETRHDRLHAADERTDPGAPPAQEEPG